MNPASMPKQPRYIIAKRDGESEWFISGDFKLMPDEEHEREPSDTPGFRMFWREKTD